MNVINDQHIAVDLGVAGVAEQMAEHPGTAAFLGNAFGGGLATTAMYGLFAATPFMFVQQLHRPVHEVGLFGTTIITPDNVMTIVGNGKVFGDTIQNFSVLPVRRVERVAQLANGVDPLDAIARCKAAVALIPNISKEMPPEVNLLDFKLEGPQIAVRPYTHTDHYWQVYFDTNEAIVRVCTEAGWPAPASPQLHRRVA